MEAWAYGTRGVEKSGKHVKSISSADRPKDLGFQSQDSGSYAMYESRTLHQWRMGMGNRQRQRSESISNTLAMSIERS